MKADRAGHPAATATVRFDGNTLYLAGILNFDTVISLNSDVSDWFRGRSSTDCIADLAGVEYSNSAGIALLLSWMRLAADAGSALTLCNVPADMLALAAVGGLSSLFGMPAQA